MLSSNHFSRLTTSVPNIGRANMPIDLVLVRHGIAEGNRAFTESRQGNESLFTKKFMETHESKWRLTSMGQKQAQVTGDWIRANIGDYFGAYYTSEYIRAIETAAFLDLPHAHWTRTVFLHERNFGRLSSLSHTERQKRFGDEIEERKRDQFYWIPPSGESLADVALRVDYLLDSLSTKPLRPSSAIIVTHHNVMQVFRVRLELIRQANFTKEVLYADDMHKIRNASVLQYTRRNPLTKEIMPSYQWKRMVTPWLGGKYVNTDWEQIQYSTLSNEQILKELSAYSDP